jgi:hypothetical protein
MRIRIGTALVWLTATSAFGAAQDSCPIVDAIAPLAAVAASTTGKPDDEQIAAYRRALIDPQPGLYTRDVLGLSPGPAFDAQILASLAQARSAGSRAALEVRVRAEVAATAIAFRRAFADFRCNFPVYLSDTLGQLDGAGRVVDHRPAMVIGIGSIEEELPRLSLPVFFKHEFFHRYHFQAAGFSDDPGERQEIWRALWAEGLATYVSQVLTPGATTADALLSARLEERAQPLLPRLSSELLGGMDRIDPELFHEYFTTGGDRPVVPARAGYYVGYVIASRLARHHSLDALPHLKGAPLHEEIARTLRELAESRDSI